MIAKNIIKPHQHDIFFIVFTPLTALAVSESKLLYLKEGTSDLSSPAKLNTDRTGGIWVDHRESMCVLKVDW